LSIRLTRASTRVSSAQAILTASATRPAYRLRFRTFQKLPQDSRSPSH